MGIQPTFYNNYKWSITFKNCKALYCIPIIYIMLCCAKSPQSRWTLCDPMDWSPPGSSVHDILQARILEWVPMPSSRGSFTPRDQTHASYVSCTCWQILYHQCHLASQSHQLPINQEANLHNIYYQLGLPWWFRWQRILLQCGRPGFDSRQLNEDAPSSNASSPLAGSLLLLAVNVFFWFFHLLANEELVPFHCAQEFRLVSTKTVHKT